MARDRMREIERLKAALREIANMDDPAISAQQVAADALEGKCSRGLGAGHAASTSWS